MYRLIHGALGLVLLAWAIILAGGIIAPRLVGSDKIYDPAPVLAWFGIGRDIVAKTAQSSNQDRGPNPAPITSVVGQAAKTARGRVNREITRNPGNPIIQRRADTNQPDARLAACRPGSIESQNAREIPYAIALNLKNQIDGGAKINSLIQLQAQLGQPACNERLPNGKAQWTYLVAGGRTIKAREEKASIKIDFVRF